MRNLLMLALFAFALPVQANWSWSNLWRNADQRGEALLQRGDAAAAAREYADPRRKAYAELKAGDYAAAARDLATFDDIDANYNRGNALAHAGDLQGAIGAYDAALKHDPHNQDARHNRELVAKALKQKSPQQQNSDGKKPQDGNKDGQNGGHGSPSPGQDKQDSQAKPGDLSKQGDNGKNDRKTPSPANNRTAHAGQAGQQASTEQRAPAQEKDADTAARQNQQDGAGKAATPSAMAQTNGRDDAEQARRDAAASLAEAKARKQGGTDIDGAIKNNAAPPPPVSLSEKQLAQEQWLRGIPDDPSGLLRRKFLIEHMMRQQKTQP